MEITPGRLATMLRPRSVALVGAAEKSGFSRTAYGNLVAFGRGETVHLVNRRGAVTHGRPTVTSCQQIGEPADLAFLMVPQAGTLDALADAAAAGIRNAIVLSAGYAETARPDGPPRMSSSPGPASSACCCSARTCWASPTSSIRSRSPRSPACPVTAGRLLCCRKAGPVPAPWSNSPLPPGSACPTW